MVEDGGDKTKGETGLGQPKLKGYEGKVKKKVTIHYKKVNPYKLTIPYPQRISGKKKDIVFKTFIESTKVLKVSIPLLTLLGSNPKYIKMVEKLI